MANLSRFLKSDLNKGVAIGLGLGTLAVSLAPVLRPLAKNAVKTGLLALDSGRIWAVEARDSIDELVAGVRSSVTESSSGGDGATPADKV